MAGSLNKVTIIGHLGKDPEVRRTQQGKPIANFSVATSESWKDKQTGEKREKTEWHRVVIFNEGLAGVAEKYLKKGSKVYIEGQLQTRKWNDNNNVEKYTTEIVLQGFGGTMLMLGEPGGNRNADDGDQRSGAPSTGSRQSSSGAASQQSRFDNNDMDDDIPF